MPQFPTKLFKKSAALLAIIPGLAITLAGCTPATDGFHSEDVNRKSKAFERESDTGKYFYITTGRKRPAEEGTGEYNPKEKIIYSPKTTEKSEH